MELAVGGWVCFAQEKGRGRGGASFVRVATSLFLVFHTFSFLCFVMSTDFVVRKWYMTSLAVFYIYVML